MPTQPSLYSAVAALTCLRASLYIAEFLDGTLGDRQTLLAEHVHDCTHCRRMLLVAYAQRHGGLPPDAMVSVFGSGSAVLASSSLDESLPGVRPLDAELLGKIKAKASASGSGCGHGWWKPRTQPRD
jgi:hypothetical protein